MKWGLEFLPHAAFEMAECQMQRVREALRNVSPCIVGLLRPSGKIFKTPGVRGQKSREKWRHAEMEIRKDKSGDIMGRKEEGREGAEVLL